MKIHLLSDLHLEFRRTCNQCFQLADVGADVLVLAGDIDTKLNGVRWAMAQAERLSMPVLYICGNHEYYGERYGRLLQKMRVESAGSGVHVLENDRIVLHGVTFLCCTLWTDFALSGAHRVGEVMTRLRESMNDFRKIRVPPRHRRWDPVDAQRAHLSSRRWLEAELRQPTDGPVVVVSHHAPSAHSIPEDRRDDDYASAYASDLSTLAGLDRVDLWLHGHVHAPADYHWCGVRVVCNPAGYWPNYLVEGFDPDKVLTI